MKPVRKRQLVDHARATWQVSIRRACRALPVHRSTYHYRSRRAGQAHLSKRIREIAATRVRYGYRRIHVLLRREGWQVNPKRVYRMYREMGLQLRNKTPKRRVQAKLREDRQSATRPNETWAMDFVHDQLATGRKLRCLRSLTRSRASRRRSNLGSTSAALMLWRYSKKSAGKSDSRKQSGLIKAQSLSHAILTSGLISAASRSTSPDRESPLTTPSSSRSTANSERNV